MTAALEAAARQDPAARFAAVGALARQDTPAAAAALGKLLASNDPAQRRHVQAALERMQTPDARRL